MTTANGLADMLLAALRKVPQLRPATSATTRAATLVPWDLDLLAVDVSPDVVELRLVALALPLAPSLRDAETVLRQVLVESGQPKTALRLVITDLDATALRGST